MILKNVLENEANKLKRCLQRDVEKSTEVINAKILNVSKRRIDQMSYLIWNNLFLAIIYLLAYFRDLRVKRCLMSRH
jgi:hypothetical protein